MSTEPSPITPPKSLWRIVGDAPPPVHLAGKAAKKRFVLARCECGTEMVHERRYIETKRSLSCGCESRPRIRKQHAYFVGAQSF